MSEPEERKGRLRTADLLELATSSLRSNLLRTSLTVLGVAIGVFSVVGVMTALSAMRQSIDTSLSVFGANVLQVSKNPAIQVGGPGERRRRPNITPRQAEDFRRLMAEDGIPVSLIAYDGGERASYADKKTGPILTIVGTNQHYILTNKYEIERGRNLSPADIEFNRAVAVVGYNLVEELFPVEDPIGKAITVDNNRFTIVGILKKRGELFGQSMDNLVLIPINRFVAQNWGDWRTMEMAVQAPGPLAMARTEDLAITHMRQARGLEPEDENNFEITSNESLQAAFGKIAKIVGVVGLGVSAIALVCAGVGIMAIMLVSVTERTREIGVRKSLGARKTNVLLQFLLEAIFLSEAGAAIGIVLGTAVGNFVAAQLNATMIIPWFWMAVAVTVCSFIGIGFGLYPAWRAANLNPVDALRYE